MILGMDWITAHKGVISTSPRLDEDKSDSVNLKKGDDVRPKRNVVKRRGSTESCCSM
jgi:hypothetical protein